MIHVLTAFSRPSNIEEIWKSIKDQGVRWHLIGAAGGHSIPSVGMPEVYSYREYVPKVPPIHCGWLYGKLNWFVETQRIIDTDYYGVLNDDDLATPGMFDKIRMAAESRPEVIFISQHFAAGIDLLACSENVRPSKIIVEQYYVRGDILKQHRYVVDDLDADGRYARTLLKARQCVFVPDAWVIFNALQPERWTQAELNAMLLCPSSVGIGYQVPPGA